MSRAAWPHTGPGSLLWSDGVGGLQQKHRRLCPPPFGGAPTCGAGSLAASVQSGGQPMTGRDSSPIITPWQVPTPRVGVGVLPGQKVTPSQPQARLRPHWTRPLLFPPQQSARKSQFSILMTKGAQPVLCLLTSSSLRSWPGATGTAASGRGLSRCLVPPSSFSSTLPPPSSP